MTELLLVEDDRAIVENLREFLAGEGFCVTPASGQKEALDLLEERHFDIVLLDISLSDGNGFAVCQKKYGYAGHFPDGFGRRMQRSDGTGYGGGRLY